MTTSTREDWGDDSSSKELRGADDHYAFRASGERWLGKKGELVEVVGTKNPRFRVRVRLYTVRGALIQFTTM